MAVKPTRVRYVGDGEHYMIGVPMADHEAPSQKAARFLVESGLYEIDEEPGVLDAEADEETE